LQTDADAVIKIAQSLFSFGKSVMTEPEAGTAGIDATVPRSRSPVPAVAFALLAPFAVAAYLTSAIKLEAFFCPPTAWKFGALGSVASLQVGMFLIVLCIAILVIRTSSRIADRKLSPVFGMLRTIAKNDYYCTTTILYSLLVIAALWINYWQSYYCVGPDGIVFRTGMAATPRATAWGDVKAVQARCAITNAGLEGGLTITLDNGTTVPLRLKTGAVGSAPGDYAPIRAALAGRHYKFSLAPSVTQNACPPELYQVFTTWGQ
jgi:hypothetical protein